MSNTISKDCTQFSIHTPLHCHNIILINMSLQTKEEMKKQCDYLTNISLQTVFVSPASIEAHRNHFVRLLSVPLSGSHTFFVVTLINVLQATHSFLGILPFWMNRIVLIPCLKPLQAAVCCFHPGWQHWHLPGLNPRDKPSYWQHHIPLLMPLQAGACCSHPVLLHSHPAVLDPLDKTSYWTKLPKEKCL